MATIRTLLARFTGSLDFLDGLGAAGVNIDAPLPLKADAVVSPLGSVSIASLCVTLKAMGNYLKNGEKIQAIKVLRDLTGLGLKETKDLVDLFPTKPYAPPY